MKYKNQKKKKEPEEEIEILDVYEDVSPLSKKATKEVNEDTLDLDELFKTMSINIINDDSSFDFGLIRENKGHK